MVYASITYVEYIIQIFALHLHGDFYKVKKVKRGNGSPKYVLLEELDKYGIKLVVKGIMITIL